MALPENQNPEYARPTRTVEGLRDRVNLKGTTTGATTESIEDLLGAGKTNVLDVGVMVTHDGTLQYDPAGAADASGVGFIPSPFIIWGDKAFLDAITFYSAGAITVSFLFLKDNV